MSLQVWLPLTKDLRQQGLKNISATIGGTVGLTDVGKLGKCATIGAAAGGITLPASAMTSFTECSVAFWINITSWNTNWDTIFQAGLGSTPWNNYIFGILRNQGNYLCFTVSNGSSTSSGSYASSNLTVGQWMHLAFTYGSGKCKIYINGVFDKEYSTSITPNFAGITHIAIGRSTNGSSYQSKCKLNDFRIYDHCLSPMEVKELAKGLVLHYPLNRNGWGQENLITQTMIDADPWKSAISGNYTVDGKTGWILSNNQLYSKSGNGANNIFSGLTYEANTQYTISFKWRDDYRTDGKSSSLYIRFKYSDGTYSQVISSKDYNYWKEEIMTSTAGKTVSAITTTYGNGGNLLFTDLKLEKGAIKTPTSPIVNSDLYNSMGLNSTIEYDCSGYCKNGTRTGTFSWINDTPRYNVSTAFEKGIISIPNSFVTTADPIFSVSLWFKLKSGITYTAYTDLISFSSSSYSNQPFRLELCGTPVGKSIMWFRGPSGQSGGFAVKSDISTDEWYHTVLVSEGNKQYSYYVNGEKLGTYNGSANSWTPTGNVSLGENINGVFYESDVRIYATALSAEDVLELYHTAARIDNVGNTYVYQYIEI